MDASICHRHYNRELIAGQANPEWKPDQELAGDRRAIWCPLYGINSIGDLFTPRQLLALTTFSDLVQEARDKVLFDAKIRYAEIHIFRRCGAHVTAYADAIATYLAFAVDRSADFWSSIAHVESSAEKRTSYAHFYSTRDSYDMGLW